MTLRFSNRLVPELYQPFWAAWQGGEFLTDAAALAGTYRHHALAWLRQEGGVRPRRGRDWQGRYLSFTEREEIALGVAAGESIRSIAAALVFSSLTYFTLRRRRRSSRGTTMRAPADSDKHAATRRNGSQRIKLTVVAAGPQAVNIDTQGLRGEPGSYIRVTVGKTIVTIDDMPAAMTYAPPTIRTIPGLRIGQHEEDQRIHC